MLTKWLTSMEVFAPIVVPILERVNPKRICEIGAAEGGNTKLLYNFLKQRQGKLITIDPFPRGSFTEWVKECSDVMEHIADYSLNGIPKVGQADIWFVDGDHNWYTVFNELSLIDKLAQQTNIPILIFMHDIGWPCARRDMYYDPNRIPAAYAHPYSSELGIFPNKAESAKGGFRGPNWALKEGGPRNGVLTAVEDFLKNQKGKYHWINIPAVLGLGILVDVNHPFAEQIIHFYAPYHNNPIMALLEQDRINHYMGVVTLNDMLAEHG